MPFLLSASQLCSDEKQTKADYINQPQFTFCAVFVSYLYEYRFVILHQQVKEVKFLVMMNSFLLFSALVLLLLLLIDEKKALVSCQNQKCDDKVEATTVFELISIDSDFENGKIDPWIEQSESGVKWKIENSISPWEPENAAPYPPYGRNYLRVNRGAALSFGVAVLRSPTFTILADNDVLFSFSFWIRSKWLQFTNLEVIHIVIVYQRTSTVYLNV